MNGVLCLLLDGTKQQREDYIKLADQVGNVFVVNNEKDATEAVKEGHYVIFDYAEKREMLSMETIFVDELIGVSFGATNSSPIFDRFYYIGEW